MSAWIGWLYAKLRWAHVTLDDAGLSLLAHRCSIWGPIRLGAARLAWLQVRGVEFWTAWSRIAPGGELRTCRIFTEQGTFEMTNIYWPEVDDIANEVSQRSGQPVNAALPKTPSSTGSQPAAATARSWSVTFVHAFAWTSVVGGIALAALILLGQLGGAGLALREIAMVLAMGAALVAIGLRLRQYPWTDDSAGA